MAISNPPSDGYELASQHSNGPAPAPFMDSFASIQNSGPVTMNHNPGISMDWSTDEHASLEEGLNTFAQHSSLACYAKIAARLPKKTIRDVALRVQWRKKQIEKNRKRREYYEIARRSKDKMQREKSSKMKADSSIHKEEIVIDPSGKSTQLEAPPPRLSPYAQVMAGDNGQLLQRNAMVLLILDVNINSYHKKHNNIPHFHEVRENILKVMNNMGEIPEEYKHLLPPLGVKLNEELFNQILNGTNVNHGDGPPSIM